MNLVCLKKNLQKKQNLHRTYISAIESKRRSISLDNIQKIADAIEIETYKLFIDEAGVFNE